MAADRPAVPRGYRTLLFTYPSAWRAAHGAVVLDTVLSLHADQGKTHPSTAERFRFALDGLRVRVAARRRRHPAFRFASPASLVPLPSHDQSNGIVTDSRPLDEWEQVHANGATGQNDDEQRTAPLAWFQLNAGSRPDHTAEPGRRHPKHSGRQDR